MTMKYLTRSYWHRKYIRLLELCHAKWLDRERNRELYHTMTGKWLRFSHPTDLNQKLIWLNWYWDNPLKAQCADKYRVREYVESVGLGEILVPLLGVWDHADAIDFDALPSRFVLKCNHGSGYNIICTDKEQLDIPATRAQLDEWLHTDYHKLLYEVHYKSIPRKIICEKFIGEHNTAPAEYQLWCVNGEPESILACRKNLDHTYEAASYSLQWERLFDRIGEEEESVFEKPACGTDTLIRYARTLAKPFPFARIDFYVVGTTVYLAEITLTPSANILNNYKQSFLDRLGSRLTLPRKKPVTL